MKIPNFLKQFFFLISPYFILLNAAINFYYNIVALIKRILIFLLSLVFIIILFFSVATSLYADDVKKFKIEGISLGDSVLDHFPGRDVVNNINSKYNHSSDEYHVSDIFQHSSFKKFDKVSLVIQSDNEEILFPISGMSGLIYYEKNIEDCYREKENIVNELQSIFKDAKVEDPKVLVHPDDLSGKSFYEVNNFHFDWGFARVSCYDMADHINIPDALLIDIFYKEVDEWLKQQSA